MWWIKRRAASYSWQSSDVKNTKYTIFRSGGPSKKWDVLFFCLFVFFFFLTDTFMVASNKQMVDLTYLCFCFWMTDQMHDGKCNELLVREDTIHGRGPAKAAYIPNLVPSLWFLRLVMFFFCIIVGCCASSCSPASFPSELPSPHWQAGSWWGN